MKIVILISIFIFVYISIYHASKIEIRGIVEGFYGTPWTFEDRADLIKFCGNHNLNAYIYAPKDDLYHRNKWREPYPEDKIIELKNLIILSQENKVRFIFAVSPGIDLNYNGDKGEEDFQILMTKLHSIYEIGCRDFAIFFDDINANIDSGKNQAIFLNRLYDELKQKYNNKIKSLITVPTDYSLRVMIDDDDDIKQYTKDFSTILNKKIIVLYTGDITVGNGISNENYKKTKKIYGRDLGIWWNYPVNDFLKNKLALGPIEKLPTSSGIKAIFYNPMEQPQLSKISIATGADYAQSPYSYNPEKSWNHAIEEQFKENAEAMKIFARHSRHMEKNWANVGPPDGPEFNEASQEAIMYYMAEEEFSYLKLISLLDEMDKSADTLLSKLDYKILSECKPHLEQFKRIIKADRLAVRCLEAKSCGIELTNLRKEISEYEPQAILSEKSALKFIDNVIDIFQK